MGLTKQYVAVDIGGGGGRTSVGSFDGKTLKLDTVGSFTNDHINMNGTYYWDFLHLFGGLKNTLSQIRSTYPHELSGIGIDTMGVNFGLLDIHGQMLSNPLYTRISQEREIEEFIFSIVSPEVLYNLTGLQLTKLNSLYHIARLLHNQSPSILQADQFLMLPDLLNYMLTGRKVSEYTIASTSHLMNAQTKSWDNELISRFGLDRAIFPEIVKPGTIIENLSSIMTSEIGLAHTPVIATASHDTAAALAFVPTTSDDFAYISSGTWGMMGTDISRPLLSDQARDHHFANEGAAFDNIRFLHNSVNLWLLKECKRSWREESITYDWNELTELALFERPFSSYIDPQDPDFLMTRNMPDAIRLSCQKRGQQVPDSIGAVVRIIYESLALKYSCVFDDLCDTIGRRPNVLHIVGGGARDDFMSQCIANALDIRVVCGPYDATVMGNILMQMVATREISSQKDGLEIMRDSCEMRSFVPEQHSRWSEENARYREFIKNSPVVS